MKYILLAALLLVGCTGPAIPDAAEVREKTKAALIAKRDAENNEGYRATKRKIVQSIELFSRLGECRVYIDADPISYNKDLVERMVSEIKQKGFEVTIRYRDIAPSSGPMFGDESGLSNLIVSWCKDGYL